MATQMDFKEKKKNAAYALKYIITRFELFLNMQKNCQKPKRRNVRLVNAWLIWFRTI